jgi:hypothetical protein
VTRAERAQGTGRKDNARKGLVRKRYAGFRKNNVTAIWPVPYPKPKQIDRE